MQERAGPGRDVNRFAVTLDGKLIERLQRRRRLTRTGAKAAEVVVADEALGRRVHGLGVERRRHLPGPSTFERQGNLAVDDPVKIGARAGGKPGIEVGTHRRDFEDRYRGRSQIMIDSVANDVRRPRFREVHMNRLAEGVDAGVGASGRLNRDFFVAKSRHRGFQCLLNRYPDFLTLPADEAPAVVLHDQLVAGHGNTLPRGIRAPRR